MRIKRSELKGVVKEIVSKYRSKLVGSRMAFQDKKIRFRVTHVDVSLIGSRAWLLLQFPVLPVYMAESLLSRAFNPTYGSMLSSCISWHGNTTPHIYDLEDFKAQLISGRDTDILYAT